MEKPLIVGVFRSEKSYERIKIKYGDYFEFADTPSHEELFLQYIPLADYSVVIYDKRVGWEEFEKLVANYNFDVIYFDNNFDEVNEALGTLIEKYNLEVGQASNENVDFISNEISEAKTHQEENKANDPVVSQNATEKVREVIKEKVIVEQRYVPVYRDVYSSVDKRIIAVYGLSKGAGASFIALNLAAAFREYNILVSVVESGDQAAYIFDDVGLAKYTNDDLSDFISYLEMAALGDSIKPDGNLHDGISWYVRKPGDEIQEWGFNNLKQIISVTTKSPIVIVDMGCVTSIDDLKMTSPHFTDVFLVIDPKLGFLDSTYEAVLSKIYDEYEGFENLKITLNKWNSGIVIRDLESFVPISSVYMQVPVVEMSDIYKASYEGIIPYAIDTVREVMAPAFSQFVREVLPQSLIEEYTHQDQRAENEKPGGVLKRLLKKGNKK